MSQIDTTDYAVQLIHSSMTEGQVYYADGTLQEFIEAADFLNLDYDYEKNEDDGYDFMAWDDNCPDECAQIKL